MSSVEQGEVSLQPSSPKSPSRVTLTDSELSCLSQNDWSSRWRQQDQYIVHLERKLAQQEGELADLRQTQDRFRTQFNESQQRERVLVRRLAAKEQETQDYVCQLNELKSGQAPTTSTLRSSLLDPAVNCLLQQLRNELQTTRSKLEDTQNELSAWKFTPDSNTGKRLMAKCRLLYQENEELGKICSSGRIAKLESDLALQKSFSEEVRQTQNELDAFLADLDEDVEGMQSTILFLQQELRKTKDHCQVLQKEISTLKSSTSVANSNSNSNSNSNIINNNNNNNNGRSNGDSSSSVCGAIEQQATAQKTDSESDDGDQEQERTRVKRVRRSSVLSIDFNEDDALVIQVTNGDVAMSSDPE